MHEKSVEIRLCVLIKGSEAAAHLMSDVVMDPDGPNEPLPRLDDARRAFGCGRERRPLFFLTKSSAKEVPNRVPPDSLRNNGNYVISLTNLTSSLGQYAEALGVEIFLIVGRAIRTRRQVEGLVGFAARRMRLAREGPLPDAERTSERPSARTSQRPQLAGKRPTYTWRSQPISVPGEARPNPTSRWNRLRILRLERSRRISLE
jgi:hypothetical protein